MEPFKNLINPEVITALATAIKTHESSFNEKAFLSEAWERLDALELKERIWLQVELCHKYLPKDYRRSVEILRATQDSLDKKYQGIACIFMPDFVGKYGLEDFDFSLDALEHFTKYSTSEFGIRPFLIHDLDRAIARMIEWSKSENHHVRRLSSEGSRPRLPWGLRLQELVKNPEPVRPILENLKADEEEYVRKSVANHLNDISKDNPDWMLDLVTSWDDSDKRTGWIIKHAARGLIKKGEPRAFALFGFTADPKVEVENLELSADLVKIGDELTFSFDLVSKAKKKQKLAVDYLVHYVKKNGKTSPKVFKLRELELAAGERKKINKKQSFADVSIRKHNPGEHMISLQVNGRILAEKSFEVTK